MWDSVISGRETRFGPWNLGFRSCLVFVIWRLEFCAPRSNLARGQLAAPPDCEFADPCWGCLTVPRRIGGWHWESRVQDLTIGAIIAGFRRAGYSFSHLFMMTGAKWLPSGAGASSDVLLPCEQVPRMPAEDSLLREHEVEIRVRYQDADPMGLLHHANYFTYFEIGRTELLRASGGNYRRMEEDGIYAVVVKAECAYHKPARYDDLLTIRTIVKRVTPAKIEHEYRVLRDDQLLATAQIALALVDRKGEVMRVPDWLLNAEFK